METSEKSITFQFADYLG